MKAFTIHPKGWASATGSGTGEEKATDPRATAVMTAKSCISIKVWRDDDFSKFEA
jgi:hypothetical protein